MSVRSDSGWIYSNCKRCDFSASGPFELVNAAMDAHQLREHNHLICRTDSDTYRSFVAGERGPELVMKTEAAS